MLTLIEVHDALPLNVQLRVLDLGDRDLILGSFLSLAPVEQFQELARLRHPLTFLLLLKGEKGCSLLATRRQLLLLPNGHGRIERKLRCHRHVWCSFTWGYRAAVSKLPLVVFSDQEC